MNKNRPHTHLDLVCQEVHLILQAALVLQLGHQVSTRLDLSHVLAQAVQQRLQLLLRALALAQLGLQGRRALL
jgi:hypothetical protein